MSRAGDVRTVNKVIDAADGIRREGADIRSKNVEQLRRSSSIPKLKLIKSKKMKMGILGFILGFITSTWVNVANRPPPVIVKKVVRKKKPKLTIEELPDDGPEDPNDAAMAAAAARPGEEMKMVLVVNDSLGMSAGKIAAQCCHATLAVYQSLEGKHKNVLRQWESEGQKKIALKCNTDAQLAELVDAAKKARLPHHLVQDAGRTQVAAGSRTVLAIGPAPESAVNQVTGSLRLL